MTFLLTLLLALAHQEAGSPVGRPIEHPMIQRGCPPEHRNAAMRVRNLLTSPLLPELKNRYDLGTASADDTHLLTNRNDREVCQALWEAIEASGTDLSAGDHVTFYRSGDTFFVPIKRHRRPGRPGTIQLDGFSSLDVYSSEYRLVGRFGA